MGLRPADRNLFTGCDRPPTVVGVNATRSEYLELVDTLLASREPCDLACRLMATLLEEAGKLSTEINKSLDQIVALAHQQQMVIDDEALAGIREDLAAIALLQTEWQSGPLFSRQARQRVGILALPAMVASLVLMWRWINLARAWWERMAPAFRAVSHSDITRRITPDVRGSGVAG